MTDIDKVIKRFQYALEAAVLDENMVIVDQRIVRDAITLLEAQKPRIYTIEEVKSLNCIDVDGDDGDGDTFYWLEFADSQMTWLKYLEKDDEYAAQQDYEFAFTRYGGLTAVSSDEYNKTWRCWTSKPTIEERQEVPWDD